MSIFTESFNTADSSTLGPSLSWTEFDDSGVQDRFAIVSNTARCSVGFNCYARADSDVATTNHYVQAVVDCTVATDAYGGVLGRKDSSTTMTCYIAYIMFTEDLVALVKRVNGTETVLGSTVAFTAVAGVGYLIRLEMNGTALRVLIDGVEKISLTDSSISTGTRGGLYGNKATSGAMIFDSFEVGDLAGGAKGAMHNYLRNQ